MQASDGAAWFESRAALLTMRVNDVKGAIKRVPIPAKFVIRALKAV
jgi:hypothetical protein